MLSNQASVPNPLPSCLQNNEDTLFCPSFMDDNFPKTTLCTYSFLTDTCFQMRKPFLLENCPLEKPASGVSYSQDLWGSFFWCSVGSRLLEPPVSLG